MLKRIYIDNFKCLVNFDLTVDRINLLLGPNGSGKSSIFEVLHRVRAFISGDEKIPSLFRANDRTRWQNSPVQTFELDVEGNGGLYRYELAVEQQYSHLPPRVKHERLSLDGHSLLTFETGEVQLFRDNFTTGPKYSFDWSLSAVASILPRPDNTKLTWFKEWVKRIVIVQVLPTQMTAESSQEEARLSRQAENFASWYRYLSQDQGQAIGITDILRQTLPGFDHFKFTEAGDKRILKASFVSADNNHPDEYRLDELSDGQRALMVLYSLLTLGNKDHYLLCIDEPENFLALPEIQPWLVSLYDLCNSAPGYVQALLISHNPEVINYLLASPIGYWLERQHNGPTRVHRISDQSGAGLSPSELVARGWLNE